MITTGPTPELDKTNLVVGQVSGTTHIVFGSAVCWVLIAGAMGPSLQGAHCKVHHQASTVTLTVRLKNAQ